MVRRDRHCALSRGREEREQALGGISGAAGVSGFGDRKRGMPNLRALSPAKAPEESLSTIGLSSVLEVLRWRRSPPPREAITG
jgi:hypothetical protein